MSEPEAGASSKSPFPTTRWSRIAAAGDPAEPEARAALEDLCRAYWYPLYALIRRRGHSPDEAADLPQAYFVRLLDTGLIARADRRKGRFRTFLRTDCSFFLAHRAESNRARKRGGGETPLSIDARDAEGRYFREPVAPGLPPTASSTEPGPCGCSTERWCGRRASTPSLAVLPRSRLSRWC